MLKYIFTISIIFLFKDFLFGLIPDTKSLYIVVGFLGYILKIIINSAFDTMDSELKLPISSGNNSLKTDNIRINNPLYKNNGEGSSKTPVQDSPTDKDSPINYADYVWSSDESEDESGKKTPTQSSFKAESELETYKKVTDAHTLEEVEGEMNQLEQELEEYQSSGANVPAAKTQMKILEEKLNICAEKISREMEELEKKGKEPEGKGKEPEDKGKEPEGKGKEPESKRKEPEEKGKEPEGKKPKIEE